MYIYFQSLIYCSDCKGSVPVCLSTGLCERDGWSVPDNIFDSNDSASIGTGKHGKFSSEIVT